MGKPLFGDWAWRHAHSDRRETEHLSSVWEQLVRLTPPPMVNHSSSILLPALTLWPPPLPLASPAPPLLPGLPSISLLDTLRNTTLIFPEITTDAKPCSAVFGAPSPGECTASQGGQEGGRKRGGRGRGGREGRGSGRGVGGRARARRERAQAGWRTGETDEPGARRETPRSRGSPAPGGPTSRLSQFIHPSLVSSAGQ